MDFEGNGVGFDIRNAEGDSGGPIYTYDDNGSDVILIAMYQVWVAWFPGSTSCNGDDDLNVADTARGVLFDHLYDNHDIRLSK